LEEEQYYALFEILTDSLFSPDINQDAGKLLRSKRERAFRNLSSCYIESKIMSILLSSCVSADKRKGQKIVLTVVHLLCCRKSLKH